MSSQQDKINLDFEKAQVSGQLVLRVSGRMNAENSALLQQEFSECVGEGQDSLVVDLGGLAYISSMGLRTFLGMAKTLQERGGTLRLCCLRGLVQQVFQITGLMQTFSVYESVESAVLEAKH
jgi:anti-anti-sigma factor